MRITVSVKTNAKQNQIKKDAFGLQIYTTETPEKGKANKEVIKLLAEYFNVSQSRVQLIRGFSASKKIFEIL